MDLTDRVGLVTGASRGLGLEVARLLAERQVRLALVARGAERLNAAANQLSDLTEVLTVAADISQAAELVADQALERFGRVDLLVNNASMIGPSPMPELKDYPWAALLQLFRTNAVAPLHLAQLLLPQMMARGEGVIINVTSDAGVNAYPGWGGYGASKAALEHLSRTLAGELTGSRIRVYLVDPGDMNTEMHRQAEPGVDLAHLPGPQVPAPAVLHLLEHETAQFGRYEAMHLVERATWPRRL